MFDQLALYPLGATRAVASPGTVDATIATPKPPQPPAPAADASRAHRQDISSQSRSAFMAVCKAGTVVAKG